MKLFTIPNFLTLGNLFCGGLSVLFLSGKFGNNPNTILISVFILLVLSLFFDLLDGMVARAMKIDSEIGIQLDSLADMVSFGLAPGIMMFLMLQNAVGDSNSWIPYIGLGITLFSALRLAKFNVDTEQSTYFKGLATPANTIWIFSLLWIQNEKGSLLGLTGNLEWVALLLITIASCYLLVSNHPFFSFKFKGFSWKENHFKYIFVLLSLILLVFFQLSAIPFIIFVYIILSFIYRKKIKNA